MGKPKPSPSVAPQGKGTHVWSGGGFGGGPDEGPQLPVWIEDGLELRVAP